MPWPHRGGMLRYLLLRFLPRRLVPFLTVLELVLLVRRWRKQNDTPPTTRPIRNVTPADVSRTTRSTGSVGSIPSSAGPRATRRLLDLRH